MLEVLKMLKIGYSNIIQVKVILQKKVSRGF